MLYQSSAQPPQLLLGADNACALLPASPPQRPGTGLDEHGVQRICCQLRGSPGHIFFGPTTPTSRRTIPT